MKKFQLTISALFFLMLAISQFNSMAQKPAETQRSAATPISKQKLLALKTMDEIPIEYPATDEVHMYEVRLSGNGSQLLSWDFNGPLIPKVLKDSIRNRPIGTLIEIRVYANLKGHPGILDKNHINPTFYVITD